MLYGTGRYGVDGGAGRFGLPNQNFAGISDKVLLYNISNEVTVTGAGASSIDAIVGNDALQGTDANRPPYASGILSPDGVADWMEVSKTGLTQSYPKMSIAFWASDWTDTDFIMIWDGTHFYIRISAGDLLFRHADLTTASTNWTYGAMDLTDSVMRHFAFVYNGATFKIYVNAVEKASSNEVGTIDVSGDDLTLFANDAHDASFWGGETAGDFHLTSDALTLAEIKWLASRSPV